MTLLRRPVSGSLVLCCLTAAVGACSAVGFELPNYGFYGFAPRPDGSVLVPALSTERMSRAEGDTALLGEGSVNLDTVPWGSEGAWLLTRSMPAVSGQPPVEDSVWFDRWSLRTLATWRKDGTGELRMRLNRRAVDIERIGLNGQKARRRVILSAEPYALAGIELVVATLQLQAGFTGSLPIVMESRPDEMRWMRFDVARGESMITVNRGVVRFKPTWVVTTVIDGVTRRYWIAGDDRTVLRREEPGPGGEPVSLVRGAKIPRVQLEPVERLPEN